MPDLSVVITSFNARRTIGACLDSLQSQDTDAGFETIVVDSSQDGTGELVRRRYPGVTLRGFPQRKYCGDARNIGVSIAGGDIIAQIDADCVAAPDWIEQVLRAHESPYLAIGGCIGNANQSSLEAWAAYFAEFSRWMPGTPGGWVRDIPGGNMSYKRRAFEEYGAYIENTYSSDTDFHWRLNAGGHLLRFDPSIRVDHRDMNAPYSPSHLFMHGRSFGRVRAASQRFTPAKRALFSAMVLPIFLKLFLRTVKTHLKNRVYLPHFMKSLPLVGAAILFWSVGECTGYLSAGRKEP